MATVPVQANNRIWLTYQHFPYKAWNAVAELVDNSVQSYLDNKTKVSQQLKIDRALFSIRIDYSNNEMFSIWDNAMGMDLDDLHRAVQLAAPPPNTSGRSEFGMGMKTSCCWLGGRWTVITKKLGSDTEYSVTIDVKEIASNDSHELPVQEKKAGKDEHYTRIEITNMYPRLRTRAQGKTKSNLVELFRTDIEAKLMDLYWNGDQLQPPKIVPLVTEDGGKETTWKKDIRFEVDGLPVTGWVCILGEGQRGRERAGFDLCRRGRVIIGRPLGYRPQNIFGEARNDLLNQRVYGQLNLNDFPVNHLKDDFLWDGREDDFQQKLREKVLDYVDFARRYRPSKAGKAGCPSSAIVASTNDEVADELSDEEMTEQLEVVEIMEVQKELDPAFVKAKANYLRAQKIEPRIVEIGSRRFRIYHPEQMSDGDPYFFRQSAADDAIDIFINDNHPFVAAKATDESSYVMFVRMCIMDAIVEHSLLHKGRDFTATFPARLKDQLLRGFKG